MPGNQKSKTVLLVIFLIVVIIIMIVMGVFVYMSAVDKVELEEKTYALGNQVNILTNTTSSLQEQLTNILGTNTISNETEDQNSVDTNSAEGGTQTPSNNNIDGTFAWSEDYTTPSGTTETRRVILTLKSDGTATYQASDGMAAEQTRGTYVYENNQITYTRLYYNYDNGDNTEYTDESTKTEVFTVVANNTLQGQFNDQTVTLTLQQ